MTDVVRWENLDDWATRTPAEQTALRRLAQVTERLAILLPLVEARRKRLAAPADRQPRAQRRQLETIRSQLRGYGEELQGLTTETRALYEQLQPLLGPVAQQYVEQVINRLAAATEAARQGY